MQIPHHITKLGDVHMSRTAQGTKRGTKSGQTTRGPMKEHVHIYPRKPKYYKNIRHESLGKAIRSLFIIIPLLVPMVLVSGFGELFLPSIVRRVPIQICEDDVEHIRVPVHGMTFDSIFDVLHHS